MLGLAIIGLIVLAWIPVRNKDSQFGMIARKSRSTLLVFGFIAIGFLSIFLLAAAGVIR